MVTDVIKSYRSIEAELEQAKTNLRGLNDNIRRIIGRDPQDTGLRGDRKRSFNDSLRRNADGADRSGRNSQQQKEVSPTPPPSKRRPQETKSVFSRLSGPPTSGTRQDDEYIKPRLHSRVIRELPTRQEIVAAQGSDEQSRARNRRMFGSLLGTLQKFCQEESRLKEKENMKARIEKKLEKQEQQERENLKKERQILFSDRKRKQLEIRMLEQKMVRLQELEAWEQSKKGLENFIRSKTKPQIYYRPKVLNEKAQKLLASCRADLEKEIDMKRADVYEEIATIESNFRAREQRIAEKALNSSVDAAASTPMKHARHEAKEENHEESDLEDNFDVGFDDKNDDDDDDDGVQILQTQLRSKVIVEIRNDYKVDNGDMDIINNEDVSRLNMDNCMSISYEIEPLYPVKTERSSKEKENVIRDKSESPIENAIKIRRESDD